MNNFNQDKDGGIRSIATALQQHDTAAQPDPVVLSVPWETAKGQEKLAVFLPNLLSEEECSSIIQNCEEMGFEQALIKGRNGSQYLNTGKRKSGRCMVDDARAAEILFDRLKHVLPEALSKIRRTPNRDVYHCVGLNERFRVLKYEPGEYFKPHRDGHFIRTPDDPRGPGDTSFFTVMFYLNTPANGGETNFVSYRGDKLCKKNFLHNPCMKGQALVFDHSIMHESAELKEGVKYAVRTDVMYRRLPGRAAMNIFDVYYFERPSRHKSIAGGGDNGGLKPCRLRGHKDHSWIECPNNPKSKMYNGVHYSTLETKSHYKV